MPTYFWDTETVNVSRSGTGWTVDVTAAQLDADLSIKDFRVLFAGVVQDNLNFAKTTAQLLTYTGTSYDGTVEVRRLTPTAVRSLVEYQERFSSLDYNRNFERVARQVGEFRALGIGGGTVLVNDGAYGPLWSGDISAAPSRASVYAKVEAMLAAQAIVDAAQTGQINLRAPLASPTLTGIPLAPTAITADNSTKIATTAHVKAQGYATSASQTAALALKADLASPALTGTPTVPTAADATNTTQIASTAYVKSVVGTIETATPGLLNSWVNATTNPITRVVRRNQYTKMVTVEANLSRSTMPPGSSVCMNLPAGYRPNQSVTFVVFLNSASNTTVAIVSVRTNGDVEFFEIVGATGAIAQLTMAFTFVSA